MTRGGCQQKKFHLQKGDGGQPGSQDLIKTVDLSGKTYISSISDPKGTAGSQGYSFSNLILMHIWDPLM